MEQMENNNKNRRFNLPKLPQINIRNFPQWWSGLLLSWKEYFVSLPERMKRLTRREIRVKVARYLFAIIITYFVTGVICGFGFYLKRIPLNSQFGWVAASSYPFPAEIVGLQAVTLKDVADQEKIIYYFAETSGSSLGDRLEVDRKVMESIEEVRLAQKTIAQYGVKVTNKDVDEVMKKIEEENGGKEQVGELLESLYGLNIAEFKGIVRDQLNKDKVRTDVLKTIKVRHILVDDEGKAKEIKDKIDKGEKSFEDAAKEFSKDTKANEQGGLITTSENSEYVGRDSGLAQEFIGTAFQLSKGQISDPVKTEFGWHIIKVEDIKGKFDKTYSDWLKEAQQKTIIWKLYRP